MPIYNHLRSPALAIAFATGLLACNTSQQDGPPPTAIAPSPLQGKQDTAAPQSAREADAGAATSPVGVDGEPKRPGWSDVVFVDSVPVCIFAGHIERDKAKFLRDVTRQKLKPKARVVFGAFGPWECINEACDGAPSLQCSVDVEGQDLVVHTKYWATHKDDSHCTENCREVIAGCETPPLEAGSYTVKYAGKTYPLRIPSTPKTPCLQ
jgi:hypothetical protein